MDNLLPCPFCGNSSSIIEIEPHTHKIATHMLDYEGGCFIECKCSCMVAKENRAEAIAFWNTRVDTKECENSEA